MFPILGVISSILGSPSVIEKGLELIDDAFTSDEEQRESKTKAKIELLKAYAPFKVSQRYIAIMFGFVFTVSFFLVLGMTLAGYDVSGVYVVLDEFKIGWVMITIVGFYFGGGLTESIGRAASKNKKEG